PAPARVMLPRKRHRVRLTSASALPNPRRRAPPLPPPVTVLPVKMHWSKDAGTAPVATAPALTAVLPVKEHCVKVIGPSASAATTWIEFSELFAKFGPSLPARSPLSTVGWAAGSRWLRLVSVPAKPPKSETRRASAKLALRSEAAGL